MQANSLRAPYSHSAISSLCGQFILFIPMGPPPSINTSVIGLTIGINEWKLMEETTDPSATATVGVIWRETIKVKNAPCTFKKVKKKNPNKQKMYFATICAKRPLLSQSEVTAPSCGLS